MTGPNLRGGAARNALAVLVVMACVGGVGAVAWFAIEHLHFGGNIRSLLLAMILVPLGVVGVNVVLLAVDDWLDRSAPDADTHDATRDRRRR